LFTKKEKKRKKNPIEKQIMGDVNWVFLLPFGVSFVWLKNGAMFCTTSKIVS
jgi:cell division protein FtsB